MKNIVWWGEENLKVSVRSSGIQLGTAVAKEVIKKGWEKVKVGLNVEGTMLYLAQDNERGLKLIQSGPRGKRVSGKYALRWLFGNGVKEGRYGARWETIDGVEILVVDISAEKEDQKLLLE